MVPRAGRGTTVAAVVSLIALGLALSPRSVRAEATAAPSESKLRTPARIFEILEKSSLTYELGIEDSAAPLERWKPRQLSSDLAIVKNGESLTLTTLSLSEKGRALLKKGEEAFSKKDHDRALERYTKVHETEPGYHHALTLIGDIHFAKGDYDRAREYFLEVIELNFADYAAHWFLADTLWKTGKREEAVRRMTVAHLLNVHHPLMSKRLTAMREAIGRPWKDWTLAPRYTLTIEGNTVKVKFHPDWMGYALVKAVWAHEPGYAGSMAGPDHGGYADEMIYYEIAGRIAPEALILMPREFFDRVVDYVDRFH
ncbi:MAG: tetratricopeptide repeat protein [Candidatus Polarisedimenticolia bacterium]